MTSELYWFLIQFKLSVMVNTCRPQVTIATAIIFSHRYYLRQSHSKNDRRTVATTCMFLAGKVEETPRSLKDVILVSYELINEKDPEAVQKIKQKEVYEQQKELILMAERVVLATLGFNLNVQHLYEPLVETVKRLGTSLCLQFQPHHVAAGVTFLAAKFLKVRLLSDGEVWWQELDVTPRQLEEVSNQMLELYEQNREPPTQGSEVESVAGGAANHGEPKDTHGDRLAENNQFEGGGGTRLESSQITYANLTPDDGDLGSSRSEENRGIDYDNEAMNDSEHKEHGEARAIEPPSHQSNLGDGPNARSSKLHGGKDYKEGYVSEKLMMGEYQRIDCNSVVLSTKKFCELIST
ncbi:hypothetical protein Droror1_Dr00026747 [Drosera rotundifolia]